MVFPLAPLLLATQASGQRTWPSSGQWQSPYVQPPPLTTYGQPDGYPQPPALTTYHQFGHDQFVQHSGLQPGQLHDQQLGPPQAIYPPIDQQHQFVQQPGVQPGQLYGQQLGQPQASDGQPQPISYQPPAEPPPSRQVIEEEMETFVTESEANLEAQIQKLEDELEISKTTFFAEQEQNKLEYLASMERKEQQYLEDLEQQHTARTQEARTATTDYVARVQKQAMELTKQSTLYGHHSEHQSKVELLNDEGRRNREELEEKIRSAYDAVRHGQSSVDPRVAVEEARQRFDQQMQALALQRNALDSELQQNFASVRGTY